MVGLEAEVGEVQDLVGSIEVGSSLVLVGFENKTFVVFLTYRYHVESTVGFFKRIAPHFGIKLHIVTCRTMEDGKDVPVTSFTAKLEEAYELGKNLGASERDT